MRKGGGVLQNDSVPIRGQAFFFVFFYDSGSADAQASARVKGAVLPLCERSSATCARRTAASPPAASTAVKLHLRNNEIADYSSVDVSFRARTDVLVQWGRGARTVKPLASVPG